MTKATDARLSDLNVRYRSAIICAWPGLCDWWGTLECTKCEMIEAFGYGECTGNCRTCKIRLRDGCPCADPKLREILAEQGLWWPGKDKDEK